MARRVRFRARKRKDVLPFLRVNVDLLRLRITSWTVHFWRWSWNTKTRVHTLDTPGPGSVQISPGRRGKTGDTPNIVHARQPAGEWDVAEQQWTNAPSAWTEPPAHRPRRSQRGTPQ